MMSYSIFLCVVLLVSQIEMLPVESVTGLPMGSVTGLPMGSVTGLPMGSVTGLPAGSVTGLSKTLLRVKRTVIGASNGCSDGMVKLWKGGPCVTCDEYMEHKDTDECPNNG